MNIISTDILTFYIQLLEANLILIYIYYDILLEVQTKTHNLSSRNTLNETSHIRCKISWIIKCWK